MREKGDKINIGVVGVGYLGTYHAEKYARIEEVNLVGVVDKVYERACEVATRFSSTPFEHHSSLIGKIDAASVAVPTEDHFKVAKDLLDNGIDVLLEKPISKSLEEACQLIDIAQRNHLIFQIGHLERYNPIFDHLKKIISDPIFIEAHRISPPAERGIDIDVVLDLMIHDIDLLLHLLGPEIVDIEAIGTPVISPLVDIANARVKWASGCVVDLTASRISQKVMRRFRVFQPSSYISLDFAAKEIKMIGKDLREVSFSFEDDDILELEIKDFLRSVRSRERPKTDAEEGKMALEVALRIRKILEEDLRKRRPALSGK